VKAWFMCIATALALFLGGPALAQQPRSRGGQTRQPVVVKVSGGGFRWGDAAIGAVAASGAGLVLVGIGMFRRQLRKDERG
jgi:hypothetical protein